MDEWKLFNSQSHNIWLFWTDSFEQELRVHKTEKRICAPFPL
jgi:hypothetical protein